MSASLEEYQGRFEVWRELQQEVVYTLREAISILGIKTHDIESRVKDFISIIGKCTTYQYDNPFEDINDIVGVRVITLFLSDLSKISQIVYDEFFVVSEDDKTKSDNSVFGYRSIHYICTIKPEYIGPRYKKIAGQKFEIQIRTLCMHAWSAVSHYIEYKGDWDVPKELMGSLKALSGLFHVADSQFEQFSKSRNEFHSKGAVRQKTNSDPTLIDLDSIYQFLRRKYPERKQSKISDLSSLVHELKTIGVKSIEELDSIISSAAEDLDEVEDIRTTQFGALGATRVSLGLIRQDYRDLKYSKRRFSDAWTLFSTG